jgi:hypothetical protein
MTHQGAFFEGDPLPLPAPTLRGKALYALSAGRPAEVRHAEGYERFVALVESRADDPAALASDISELVEFIQRNSLDIGAEAALTTSAARFLGNSLARLQPDARWHTFEDGTVLVGDRVTKFDVDTVITRILSGNRSLGQQFTEVVQTWRDDSDAGEDERIPQPIPVTTSSDSYTRPVLPATTFIDSNAAAISYGNRWPADGPPVDSYGVESNLERFAPLHSVADALIAYLRREYQVTISEDAAHGEDLLIARDDIARAIRVTPARTDAAPLTFVFTRYPGVIIHAGALHDFPFPECGCDACDETAESQADQMERLVLAVVAGGYRERYPVGRRRWNSYALTAADGSGSESGEGDATGIPERRLQNGAERLGSLPNGWQPWSAVPTAR